MALSSLSVVASSLALHLCRPPKVAAVAAAILSRRTKNKRGGSYSKDKDSDDTVNTNDDDLEMQAPLID